MTKACNEEFSTIDLLIGSDCDSRGVDAFCLAWIKYERQLRKLTAYLVFQASNISLADSEKVRAAFKSNKGISHVDTRGAMYRLTGESAKSLIGQRYEYLDRSIDQSYRAREKIFHGQQTGDSLSRAKLLTMVRDIHEWCSLLSNSSDAAFGYDGFSGSTSLFKSGRPDLIGRVDRSLGDNWKVFVANL